MKRIVLILFLSFLGVSAMAQQVDTLKAKRQTLEVIAHNDVKFMIYVNGSCKTDTAVSKINIKRLKAGKVYDIKAIVVHPQLINNIASFKLMMDKNPSKLVLYIDNEHDNLVQLMTYKSYDRMMKKKAYQEELHRMECWELECHQDSTKRYNGEYKW